jgi:hypothetical protein
MAPKGWRQLRARLFGLASEPRIGYPERVQINALGRGRKPAKCELGPPHGVFPLAHRDCDEEPAPLGARQLTAGSADPSQTAEALRIGRVHVGSLSSEGNAATRF